MKIGICTNLPIDFNPMLDSYINYLSGNVSAITISNVKSKRFLKSNTVNHFETNYLKYKTHYLILPVSFIYVFLLFSYFLISKKHLKQKFKHYTIKDYLVDFIMSTKFFNNQLYLNFFHLYILLKTKPDVVLSICAGATIGARWYCLITNRKYIYSLYEIYPNQPTDVYVFKRFVKATIEKKGCLNAALIITFLGENYERLLRMRYKLAVNKRFLQLAYITKEPISQSSLNILYPVKLYYHGIFDSYRGLDILIRAMKFIDPLKAHLYLRGFGNFEPELRKIVQEENLENKISFLAPVSPEEIYRAGLDYDVGITMGGFDCPNFRFLMGFKIIDYILNGLAVIVPGGYILKQMVEHHDIGSVYNHLNEIQVASAIEVMINSTEELKKKKENVRALHRNNINFSKQKANFLKSLSEVA